MKNILITGSTDGIGKLTATKLAESGHNLYLHGRRKEKLDKVINEIKEVTSNNNIEGFIADFSNFDDLKSMIEEVKEKLSSLDVLINNAGIYNSKNEITESGYDVRFAVNYFAPFILTNGLLPLLKKSNAPHIINLSSAAQSSVSLEALQGNSKLSSQAAYAQSKLALTMWSIYLAEKEPNVAIIPVNPGSLLNTKMVKEAFGRHWSPADKGADILIELATAENLAEKSGNYFDNDQGGFSQAHQDAYDSAKRNILQEVTESILVLNNIAKVKAG